MMNTGESPQHIDNQLGSVLLSSARRLYSFTLKFEHLAFAAEVLLALLPKEGQHPIRELAVRQNKWMTISRARLPKIEWNRLLEPLHVLHLERMDIKVNGIPCRNLVELHLINPPSLLIAQFVYILQSNPGLQTIVLDRPVFGIDRSCTTLSINLPSLRYVQLLTDQGSVTSLLKLLVPGSHGLDLHLGYVHPASLIDVTLPFFQRAHVTSLYLKAQAPLLPLLTALPHLQQLGVTPYDIDTPVFAGLDSATNLLPELRTIDLNKCQFRDYSTLHPGLYALLSLPSIRRIRHFNCIHWEVEGSQESFVQLLKGGEFAATIIQALAPFEQHSSPFR
ncbi:hypothetical protein BDV93DRAFT_559459 [Ceratobasidium sp. AG-I]|nr:hypothetical protein BDV93DRAFT_559459 [Ceratobasidium sp. AG-I]